jgi:hypothetical protein
MEIQLRCCECGITYLVDSERECLICSHCKMELIKKEGSKDNGPTEHNNRDVWE